MRRKPFAIGLLAGFGAMLLGTLVSRDTRDNIDPPAIISQGRKPSEKKEDQINKIIDPSQQLNTENTLCKNIYRIICGKTGETRDPTGVVRPDMDGELRALRLYQEILQAHKDWTSPQADEELVKTIYTPARRGRMESAFRWVKHTLEKMISEQPASVFTAAEKRQLRRRLEKTKLELPPPATVYEDEPDLFTKNEIYYERTLDGEMRIRIGGAYFLTVKSWFNMVFTLAHEFGHAIDPCEVRSMGFSFPAYDQLAACFVREGYIVTRKTRLECGQDDQLSESFADWLAVRVASEALKAFATEFHGPQLATAAINTVRDLCEENGDLADDENHPLPEVRIGKIFGLNPKVREILGCLPLQKEYCGWTSRK